MVPAKRDGVGVLDRAIPAKWKIGSQMEFQGSPLFNSIYYTSQELLIYSKGFLKHQRAAAVVGLRGKPLVVDSAHVIIILIHCIYGLSECKCYLNALSKLFMTLCCVNSTSPLETIQLVSLCSPLWASLGWHTHVLLNRRPRSLSMWTTYHDAHRCDVLVVSTHTRTLSNTFEANTNCGVHK